MKYLCFICLTCFAFFNLSFSQNIKQEEISESATSKGLIAFMSSNYEEAAYWFTIGVEEGNKVAQFFLGSLYSDGLGVPKNSKKSIDLYKLAAEQGHPKAQFNIGLYYIQEVPSSENEAKKWFKLAAEQGLVEAQFALGSIYSNEGNETNAFYWYKLSAEQGYASSQSSLGVFYIKGQAGLPIDYFKAFEYFQLSANQEDSYGQLNLGISYEYGRGTKQDYDKAKYWYGRSCDNRNQSGCDRYRNLNN